VYLEQINPNALYQGDVIVVPAFDPDPDPHILRLDEFQKEANCACGQKPLVKGKEWRRSATSVQLKKDPGLFAEKREGTARVTVTAAIVLSHSCDIDSGAAVVLAPIVAWASLEPRFQAKIEDPTIKTPYFLLQPRGRMPKAAINLEWQFALSNKFLGKRAFFQAKASGRNEPLLRPFKETLESRVGTLDDPTMLALYKKIADQMFRAKTLDLTIDGSSRLALDENRPTDLAIRGFTWPLPDWFTAEPAQIPLTPTPVETPIISDGPREQD
jgi:hypothetical protein